MASRRATLRRMASSRRNSTAPSEGRLPGSFSISSQITALKSGGISGTRRIGGSNWAKRCLCSRSSTSPSKRRPAGQQHVEDDAERVEVAAPRHRLAGRLLRRQELGRADDAAGDGQVPAGEQAGDAEIAELDDAESVGMDGVGSAEQVRRLEVAVDDAAVVGVFEGGGDLAGDFQHVAPGQPAAAVRARRRSWGRPRTPWRTTAGRPGRRSRRSGRCWGGRVCGQFRSRAGSAGRSPLPRPARRPAP